MEEGRGGHEAGCRSTSQSGLPSVRAPPRDADGFLFRCGPRDVVPSHCRPAFFICIQSPETSARHRPSSLPWLRFLPRPITPAETHSRLPASSSSSRSPLRQCIHRDINAAVCRKTRINGKELSSKSLRFWKFEEITENNCNLPYQSFFNVPPLCPINRRAIVHTRYPSEWKKQQVKVDAVF